MDKSKFELILGAKNLRDPRNSGRGVIKRRINDYQLHDKNEDGADYDIAVIEVVGEIPFEVSTFLGCQAHCTNRKILIFCFSEDPFWICEQNCLNRI